jgi:hypothetical protein
LPARNRPAADQSAKAEALIRNLAHVAWTQHAPLKIKIRESMIYCAAAKSIRPHWRPVLISVAWDLIDATKDALNPALGRDAIGGRRFDRTCDWEVIL